MVVATSVCSSGVQPRRSSVAIRSRRNVPVAAQRSVPVAQAGAGSGAEERASRRAALAALVAGVAAIPQRAGADEKAPRQGEVRSEASQLTPVAASVPLSCTSAPLRTTACRKLLSFPKLLSRLQGLRHNPLVSHSDVAVTALWCVPSRLPSAHRPAGPAQRC